MRRVGTVEALHEAEVIRGTRDVWKEVANPRARLTVLAKLPWAREQIAGFGELHTRLCEGKRLSAVARE